MSTPTPGSDPNYPPQGGAPQGQPGWGAPQQPQGYQPQGYQPQGYQPAPSYSGDPAGYGAPTGKRPGTVTAAAVIGIVIGALGTLGGLLSLLGIGLVFDFDVILGILALLSFAVAVLMLVAGIQALTGKSPKLLLQASYASIVLQLIYLIWALVSGWGYEFTGLLGFVLPVVIVALLMQPASKQYYAARGQSY